MRQKIPFSSFAFTLHDRAHVFFPIITNDFGGTRRARRCASIHRPNLLPILSSDGLVVDRGFIARKRALSQLTLTDTI